MTVKGPADAQEKLEGVAEIVSVIAIETIGSIIDGELHAEPDVEAAAVREIAHVTDAVTADGENARFIRRLENELVSGFLYAFPAQVNGVASALIIGFNQERLRLAF